MTNQETLEKAIAKAIDGGWKYKNMDEYWCQVLVDDIGFLKIREHSHFNDIIFNHDFARALWGEKYWRDLPHTEQFYDTLWTGGPDEFEFEGQMWQYHLQQMVIADDPIKYLGENI